jgi:hypothetical protein
LIMGFLFAVSQTLLGILHGQSKSTWNKIGLVIVLGLMILVEAGLAGYRAWLISTDEIQMSPTLVDTLMVRGGIILGALLGLFVPLSESLAGRICFLDFIEPVTSAAIRWFGGLMMWLWGVVVWWSCGFYSEAPEKGSGVDIIYPPKSINDLNKDTKSMEDDLKKLGKDVLKLRDTTELDKRLDMIRQFLEYRRETEIFEGKVSGGQWAGSLEGNKEKIKKANNRDELLTLREEAKSFIHKLKALMNELQVNEEKLAGFGQIDKWKASTNQFINQFDTGYQDDLKNLGNARSTHESLMKRGEKLNNILLGKANAESDEDIPKVVINQIQELIEKASAPADKVGQENKGKAELVFDVCHKMVSEALDAKHGSEMSALNQELEKMKGKFDQYKLQMSSFPEAPYSLLENKLLQTGKNLKMYRKAFKKLSRSCFFKRIILLFTQGSRKEEDLKKDELEKK